MRIQRLCPYLVGDVYITTLAGDPANVWDGTEWEQIEDAFLLACGSNYAAGSTGGAANHTLSVDELPGHTHSYDKPNANTGGCTLTVDQLPSHTHGSKRIVGGASVLAWTGSSCHGSVTQSGMNYNQASPGSGNRFGVKYITLDDTHTHDSVGGGRLTAIRSVRLRRAAARRAPARRSLRCPRT